MDDVSRRTFKVDNDGTKVTIVLEHPSGVNNNHIVKKAQEFIAWCSGDPNQMKMEFNTEGNGKDADSF